jgi:cellobiose phosphorylase
MRYGYFDDVRREYVITRPDTPLPWMNYLGSERYFALISNTAGGYSFYQDARLRRLTRYRYNNVPLDQGGRYIYLRDRTDKDFWSPSWQPVRQDLQAYECRHGLGYTQISTRYREIETTICYFVPIGENLEVWDVTISNQRETAVELDLFSLVEFALWDALDDATNFQRNYSIGEVEVEGSVIYHKSEYRERRNHFAYFACSESLTGFETQRETFLGPYRGWENPQVVEQGATSNSIAHGWAPIGCHHVRMHLLPGNTKRVVFLLGYHENPQEQKFDPPGSQIINKGPVKAVIEHYLKGEVVEAAFENLKLYWEQLLEVLQVNTPDVHTNRMVNTWNPYQCMVTFNMSRSASFFESGVGRGMGFRDSNQDLLGFIHLVPDRARERLLDIAATQLPDGGAYHQYQPLTKRGNDAVGSNFNDDPLWLVLATTAYLKETADWSILDEPVQYDNQTGSERPLYDHLQRSLGYTLDRLGQHGLPLIGRADWNDCLNLNTFSTEPGESFQTVEIKGNGTAESVFIAGLFVMAAQEMAELAAARGKHEQEQFYLAAAQRMEASVREFGWDGDWFLRAYDANGNPIGSRKCDEGQLFIEPQGICVMAGIGLEDGRAKQALQAVKERLATPHGILLHQPAYSRYYLHLGEISSYPPGYKENAGVFCHTNPWIMIAETRLGNGDQAYDYYRRINPSAREEISEVHRCEPYTYAQMIAGRDAPTHGEAKNSWLTGTSAWNLVAINQWILGIRPTYQGLQISPVIHESWEGFEATRIFRGVTYDIKVKRTAPGNMITLKVDGITLPGETVPIPPKGTEEVLVEVTISG